MSDIYQQAINTFGEEYQIAKAIEECCEFIIEMNRRPAPGLDVVGAGTIEDAIDEIADVTIMIRQMRLIYGADAVDARIAFKLKRLEQLIADASDK